jgi:hypothetical protein
MNCQKDQREYNNNSWMYLQQKNIRRLKLNIREHIGTKMIFKLLFIYSNKWNLQLNAHCGNFPLNLKCGLYFFSQI